MELVSRILLEAGSNQPRTMYQRLSTSKAGGRISSHLDSSPTSHCSNEHKRVTQAVTLELLEHREASQTCCSAGDLEQVCLVLQNLMDYVSIGKSQSYHCQTMKTWI